MKIIIRTVYLDTPSVNTCKYMYLQQQLFIYRVLLLGEVNAELKEMQLFQQGIDR